MRVKWRKYRPIAEQRTWFGDNRAQVRLRYSVPSVVINKVSQAPGLRGKLPASRQALIQVLPERSCSLQVHQPNSCIPECQETWPMSLQGHALASSKDCWGLDISLTIKKRQMWGLPIPIGRSSGTGNWELHHCVWQEEGRQQAQTGTRETQTRCKGKNIPVKTAYQ